MERNPKLIIHLNKIKENASRIVELCKDIGIEVGGVTKGACGNVDIAKSMIEGGCSFLGDSRIKNIVSLKKEGLNIPYMLLRSPMPSEVNDVISWANFSLVSMPEIVKSLDEACRIANLFHDVIVMVDVGDLREGIWPTDFEIEEMVKILKNCRKVHCLGVGTNVGCFGGVLPSSDNLNRLIETGHKFENLLGYELKVYSGGSTSSLALVERGILPAGINQLRVGEAILLGSDVTGRRVIPYLNQDTMFLEAEVIEVRRKPSVPVGNIGADAFGNVPVFEDRGIRLRAIVGLGKQDVRIDGLSPLSEDICILGASSDHLILDVEDLGNISLGDVVTFELDYGAMLAAMTSPYVEKIIK